jgi:hypothetical protein
MSPLSSKPTANFGNYLSTGGHAPHRVRAHPRAERTQTVEQTMRQLRNDAKQETVDAGRESIWLRLQR